MSETMFTTVGPHDLPGTTVVRAREYLRVSFDSSGRERSNEEQHDDNVESYRGVIFGDPYRDTGPASKYAPKRRDGFDDLVSDLASGRFGADILVLWEASRGSRKVGEWVVLLDICVERSVRIAVTTHGSRIYDPSNAKDRRSLLEDAVDSEYESAKTSQRVRRAMKRNAEEGRPHGGRRMFGYESNSLRVVESEASIIREMTDRVLAGESTRSIAKDLNLRGVKTSAGNGWTSSTFKNLLVNPRLAGLRVHGKTASGQPNVVAQGQWPPIISVDTHRRIVAALALRSPIGRRGRTPYLLTGVLICGRCLTPLVAQRDAKSRDTAGTRRYSCRRGPGLHGCGGLTIKADDVETEVKRLVLAKLDDPEAMRQARSTETDDNDLDELNRIEARRLELASKVLELSDDMLTAASRELDRRKADVEHRLATRSRVDGPLDLVLGADGRPFKSLEPEQQRAVIGAILEHVVVGPAVRGRTAFDPDRLDPSFREPHTTE